MDVMGFFGTNREELVGNGTRFSSTDEVDASLEAEASWKASVLSFTAAGFMIYDANCPTRRFLSFPFLLFE
jgi:hypothetical protein